MPTIEKKQRLIKVKFVSISGENTIKVSIRKKKKHKIYKKYIYKTTSFLAHCLTPQDLSPGDTVIVKSTRPLSKTKSFTFVEKISKGVS